MSTDYSSGFDPVSYLNTRWDAQKAPPSALDLKYRIAISMAHFFHDYRHQWDARNAQVLELGGGPVIGNILGAGPYVSKITFTDYLPSNLEQVALWKEKSPKAFNWDSAFQHVVKEIVSEEADITAIAADWQEQLRKKITTLGHCDFTKEGFIDPSLVPAGGFDVLVTSGALEDVAKDKDNFTAMLKTCHSLLRKGGFMAATTYGKHSSYKVDPKDEKVFYALYLTKEILHEALTEAGFNIERHQLIKVDQIEFNPSECYCYVARKM